MTATDRQGNTLHHASPEAVATFDKALDALNVYRGDPVAIIDEAISLSPDCAMAHIMKGYLFGLSTEPEGTAEAHKTVESLRGQDLSA
ncbi:MAG: tetratricopeptide repeat protein, partial [Geminicoccaceae bacterium]